MHESCHRCGEELAASEGVAPFCPHCGAPQLILPDYTTATTADPEAAQSTGVLPPPRPQKVEWKTAILCAAAVAAVAGVLTLLSARFPQLVFAWWLWIFSGAAIALGLYQRRRPQARMDAMIGARIGLVAGMAFVLSIATAMAIAGLVARFGMHAMSVFDADLRTQLEKAAEINPHPTEAMRYVRLPEFRAGLMLAGYTLMSGGLVLVSAVGGAMSGMMRMRRP